MGYQDHAAALPYALGLSAKDIVTTIPTIGVINNTFVLSAGVTGGTPLRVSAWEGGAGCGGYWFISRIMRAYISEADNVDALVWVVEGSKYRGTELDGELKFLKEILEKRDGYSGVPESTPLAVLVNNAGQEGGLSVDEVRSAFREITQKFTGSEFFEVEIKPDVAVNVENALQWLVGTLKSFEVNRDKGTEDTTSVPPTEKTAEIAKPDPRDPIMLAKRLDEWVERAEKDSTPEEFLAQFDNYSLPSWDHYTHVRIAYIILTKYGRLKGLKSSIVGLMVIWLSSLYPLLGKNMIFEGIEKYIAHSQQTKGRSFHLTMTYFWIQTVHYAITTMTLAFEKQSLSKGSDDAEAGRVLKPTDFAEYLATNPYLADGNLWADYYSTEVLMSAGAKAEMVLPDKRALPNVLKLQGGASGS
ncbi:hypothetical protein EST38_g1507 [Candolleomyces aberdarensis]|uniref:Uncharacterized protein n=1 Tax=Candolleomyces aberdarensis TaxID=2316362 RepID=A0A4Q2DUS1_9AGAR|nr:hypothetical protein EST38_g1507 [Candolleomyces aberdarensis]